jgi:hypothetical protein
MELLEIRPVPAEDDDFKYVIESQYQHRPDLLAYDLYGNPKLLRQLKSSGRLCRPTAATSSFVKSMKRPAL